MTCNEQGPFRTRLARYTAMLTLLFAFGPIAEIRGETVAKKVEQWRILEIPFNSQKFKDAPPKDLTVTVSFAAEGTKIPRPAFWDGGAVWKVRFAPPKTGTWKYETACSDPGDKGLNAQTGELECVPYKGNNPNYAHGFLKVGPKNRRLVYEDGTPFFWLGDTHWAGLNIERVDACNHPDHKAGACPHGGQFQHLVQDRKRKGFNVYQTYPSANSDLYWRTQYSDIKVEHFKKTVDVMMDYLAEQGFVIALGFGHLSASQRVGPAGLKLLARYFVARYGAHPVVWITAQEADWKKKGNTPEVWRTVAREIHRLDGYGHPLSYHQRWGPHTTWWKDAWHDWGCTQGGHRNVKIRSKKDYMTFWNFTPPKPWLEGESMYERLKVCGGPHYAIDARRVAWKSTLCGSLGYTYGGAGVWLPGWDEAAVKKNRWIDLTWYQGMVLPGSIQMAHLKRFFTAIKGWERLEPRFNDPLWGQWSEAESSVIASIGNETYVVYFYGKPNVPAKLKNMDPKSTYSARWFNPRDGKYKDIRGSIKSKDGSWAVPNRPDKDDWVLLVQSGKPTGKTKRIDTGSEKLETHR